MYASTTERDWYIKNIHSLARGRCLEVGLGLGVASKVILANTSVRHLLTIENNENVIAGFGKLLPRHTIRQMDINEWVDLLVDVSPMYDFIFVDYYVDLEEDLEDLQHLATNLKPLLYEGGHMVFWIDENSDEKDIEDVKELWV